MRAVRKSLRDFGGGSWWWGIVVAAVLASPAIARGQEPRPIHRLEVWGGGALVGGGALTGRDASLRSNGASTPFTLFATRSSLTHAPAIELGVGTLLTRRVGAEARVVYGRPDLRTSVTQDAEGAPAVTVVERIDQYAIEAGVLVLVDELRLAGTTPFVAAGAGYLRQLHEGLTLVEQGHSFHVGGGVKRWLFTRDRRRLKAAGVRGDARLEVVSGGVAFDSRLRARGVLSGSFFVTF
jgi:hypothetical protein